MSNTVNRIDLANRTGALPGSRPVRQTAPRDSGFLNMAVQLCGTAPDVSEKSSGDFWERRMESHKKFMELQQKEAARRRLLMKLRMNGGSLSAAELLMGLL